MNSIISLQNVGVKYKIRGTIFRKKLYIEALKSIDLDIYKGETLGILGQNGAGSWYPRGYGIPPFPEV